MQGHQKNIKNKPSVWWPGMATKNVSVQYNGRSLPDIILLTQGLLPLGSPFKCHEEVVLLAYETTILYTRM